MGDGQKTPRGHPDFHSYVKIQRVSYSTHLSGKHSFTLLSQPLLKDRKTDGESNTFAARGLEGLFFQLCCCVSFWFWREIGFGFIYYVLMYLDYNIVVVSCQFFGSGRKQFLVLCMYLVYNTVVRLCGCVSFLVVAGDCSPNENNFLQKNLIGLLFMIHQLMCVFHKT